MKIWWPWRRKESLLTLFSNRVHSLDETSGNKLPFQSRLDARPFGAHPRNAPGGFYVVNTECITCGYPHVLAPELMEWETDSEGRPGHCFFRKQPETMIELLHAVKAVAGSCCGALRYHGSDHETIKMLKDAGCGDSVDRY
jgi:hypothetical protein